MTAAEQGRGGGAGGGRQVGWNFCWEVHALHQAAPHTAMRPCTLTCIHNDGHRRRKGFHQGGRGQQRHKAQRPHRRHRQPRQQRGSKREQQHGAVAPRLVGGAAPQGARGEADQRARAADDANLRGGQAPPARMGGRQDGWWGGWARLVAAAPKQRRQPRTAPCTSPTHEQVQVGEEEAEGAKVEQVPELQRARSEWSCLRSGAAGGGERRWRACGRCLRIPWPPSLRRDYVEQARQALVGSTLGCVVGPRPCAFS